MIPFAPKEKAVLRLALCPGAADGEWRNAAVAFFAILRRKGAQPETFLDAPRNPTPPPRTWPPITFGKYKGTRLNEVPVDYLEWVVGNCLRISPRLRREILDCLSQRSP